MFKSSCFHEQFQHSKLFTGNLNNYGNTNLFQHIEYLGTIFNNHFAYSAFQILTNGETQDCFYSMAGCFSSL